MNNAFWVPSVNSPLILQLLDINNYLLSREAKRENVKRFICGLTLVGAVFAAMIGCGKREAGDELQRIRENRHLYELLVTFPSWFTVWKKAFPLSVSKAGH